jgi:osmoprotectant transport system substrate-binding protein
MRGPLTRRWRGAALLAALCVLGLGLLAGCGSGTTSNGTTTDSPTTTASTSTKSTLPGTGRPSLTLGDKNTTEQFILGELYDLALSAQGYSVTLYRNIGPPSVTYQALEQGNLNIYPEYLNVWDSQVVHDPRLFRSSADAYVTGQTWAADHQLELLSPTPGSDTNGIAVTTAFARANHLRTLADLSRLSTTLHLGAPVQFAQSSTGLPALEQAYGFLPATTPTVVIGDQYTELQAGKIQAAYVQTTDAELSSSAFKVLGDPRHINGFGNIVPVVTTSTLAAEGPAFVETINRVDNLLTTPVLRQLNADVDLLHQDASAVAKQFLIEHGLVASTAP